MNFENLKLINGADINPEPIQWIWDGWLAKGKLHILAGSPGTGKTSLALSLAAILSTGGVWPSGEKSNALKTIIWSGEDSIEDTLIPRLIACGADLKNIEFVGGVYTRNNKMRTFDPAVDMPLLRRAIEHAGDIGLVIIDSIVSAIASDTHKNGEVRRGLQPIVDIADQFKCAVIGISHLSKGTTGRDPVERINGSIAFGAVARIVLMALKTSSSQKSELSDRLIVRAKSNLGPDRGGYYYAINEKILHDYPDIKSTYTEWGEYVDAEARDLMTQAESPHTNNRSELADAEDFLRDILSNDSLSATEIFKRALSDGFSGSTIRRAKKALGIKSQRKDGLGADGKWEWVLPTN